MIVSFTANAGQIEFTIKGETFAIDFKLHPDLPFRAVDLMFIDPASQWSIATGKQWTLQIQEQHGGREAWVEWFLDACNMWLTQYFGENVPLTEFELLEDYIRNYVILSNERFVIK